MSRAAAAILVLLLAAPARARPPEVVPWQEGAAHVGRLVAVEGTVVRAQLIPGACSLEFSEDPSALRVVLVLALFSSPAAPDRLYAGRRVRASGRVQSFQGRPEMIVKRADQIELLDAPAATSTTTTTAPPPAPNPTVLPPPPVGASPAAVESCARARDRLRAATDELAARNEDAARCLRTGTSRCRTERDAVARALEALPARETEVDRACE